MSLFQNKIAVVTGGGSGLGRALCEELARRGATVAVTDANEKTAAEVAGSINAKSGRAQAFQVDVSKASNVTGALDRVIGEYGRLDYMFNNAGIIILGEVRDMDLEHWRRIVDVNLLGVVYGTTAAYFHMVKQGHGHIVNIASLGGLVHLPTYTAYAATKHAVVGLSTSMRREASRLGVKVSVVCPGTMNTGMGASATILQADRKILESRSPNERKMDPTAAAKEILRGVERNREIIVFPFSSRLIWWMHRLRPALLAPLDSYFVNKLNAARTEGLPKSDAA